MFKLGRSSDDDEQDENTGTDERFQRRLAALQRRAERQPGAASAASAPPPAVSEAPAPIPLEPEDPAPSPAEPPAPAGGPPEPETAVARPRADENPAESPREPQETAPAEPPENNGRSGPGPLPDDPILCEATSSSDPSEVRLVYNPGAISEKLGACAERLYANDPEGARDGLEFAREVVALFGKHAHVPASGAVIRKVEEVARGLRILDRNDEALELQQGAVDLWRNAAAVEAEGAEGGLGVALINLATLLDQAGKAGEAFEYGREAVETCRKSAAEDPERYRPALAIALNNFTAQLAQRGALAPAIAAIREAVEIRGQLALDDPESYRKDFQISFQTLHQFLARQFEGPNAAAARQEMAELCRRHAPTDPSQFRPALASNLHNLYVVLSEAGRNDEALDAIIEAIEVYADLAAADPGAYRVNLIASLNNVYMALDAHEDFTSRIPPYHKVEGFLRALVAGRPGQFEPVLATHLHSLGATSAHAGDSIGARRAIEEAAALTKPLLGKDPSGELDRRYDQMVKHLGQLGAD